jgi:S-adenosyl-L-methionine methyltransferase
MGNIRLNTCSNEADWIRVAPIDRLGGEMSRLERFIRRLQAQRACLEAARRLVRDLEGPVLEFGLGNGRTYDHLRLLFPDREIFVFERKPAAGPEFTPDARHLIIGDLADTLPRTGDEMPARAVLVHSDVGSADPERDRRLSVWLAGVLPPLVLARGLVVSDRELASTALLSLPLPSPAKPGDYFFYYRAA